MVGFISENGKMIFLEIVNKKEKENIVNRNKELKKQKEEETQKIISVILNSYE